MRDLGQVFHVEAFVVPRGDEVTLAQLGEASEAVASLDWKIQDVVIVPTRPMPDYADRCARL